MLDELAPNSTGPEKKPEMVSQPKAGGEEEGWISTMPLRYKKGFRKSGQEISSPRSVRGKKKIGFVLLVVGIIFLVLIASLVFYFWAQSYLKPKEMPSSTPPNPSPPNVYQSPELKLTAEIHEGENILSSAELFFPAGSLASETVFEFKGSPLPVEMSTSTFAVLGGIYKLTSSATPTILKTVTMKINYAESLINTTWENFIRIGYFKDGVWTSIGESSPDVTNNFVTVSLTSLPADTFGLIIEQTKIESSEPSAKIIAPQITSSEDTDADGLTNTEEEVYQTGKNNPDTDGDGLPDGFEIINLANPKAAGQISLSLSGLINVYTNPSWSYTFFYPTGWLVRALPEVENREIIVVTNTGEFFQVLVEDNNEQLSPKNWYLQKSPQVDPQTVNEEIINGLNSAWAPNGLNLYLGKGNKIYILSYDIGTELSANFKSTFQMIIKSFSLISQPAGGEEGQ